MRATASDRSGWNSGNVAVSGGVAVAHVGNPSNESLRWAEMTEFLQEISRQHGDVRLIIGGDFNSRPDTTLYRIMRYAFNHTDPQLYAYPQPYGLKSGYAEANGGQEPEVTFCTDQIRSCVDYIFYRHDMFRPVAFVPLPPLNAVVAAGNLPNGANGSDHLPVQVYFRVTG
jgi:endonuclease/exonuclease/phosphatase family metal-dependent hydrolase